MDQNNSIKSESQIISLGGKSWTAYIRIAVLAFILLLIITPVAWSFSNFVGIVTLIIFLAFLAYQTLMIKSFHLYFDDTGIWICSGVLPWNKGIAGVKWRDLDEAVYFQSLGSWLFKSYTIRIGHRFTKSSEIILSHWAKGHETVMKINEQHADLVRSNSLT